MFSVREISSWLGRPTLLIDFTRGETVWRYTAADRDITINDETFTAKPVSVSAIRKTGDSQTDELTITVPSSLNFISTFEAVPPADRVTARVMRYHQGDTDYAVRWVGFVNRVRRTGRATSEVKCGSLISTLRRGGARLTWQRQCPHMVYDSECKVSKGLFAVYGEVTSMDAININVAEYAVLPAGRLRGGFVTWTTAEGLQAWRSISEHSGTTIALIGGTRGIEVGTAMTAYPGCPRSIEGCASFNNVPNFGGIRHLPDRSPFDGNPVF